MFFTGDLVPASEFCRLGAIEEIAEDEPVAARAIAFARQLATKSQAVHLDVRRWLCVPH
jgi:enoyl-CoA hydratase/carnithine racemase